LIVAVDEDEASLASGHEVVDEMLHPSASHSFASKPMFAVESEVLPLDFARAMGKN